MFILEISNTCSTIFKFLIFLDPMIEVDIYTYNDIKSKQIFKINLYDIANVNKKTQYNSY